MPETELQKGIAAAISALYGHDISTSEIALMPTRKEFEGNYTFVTFSLTKALRKKPEEIGKEIGEWLLENSHIAAFNVVKGFLNLSLAPEAWIQALDGVLQDAKRGQLAKDGDLYLVEYSSPNTNKPLHLGHLRNNFLGWSVAEILKASGKEVRKVQIVNDRGIHICKSMVAWQHYAEGQTPESTGKKGDKFVGDYYVKFDKVFKQQIAELVAGGMEAKDAEKQAPIFLEAQATLRKWEQNDPETVELWKTMNNWVYVGFDTTYKTIGVDFDKLYYESETYLRGRDEVLRGLEQGLFFKKDDGSIWVDLGPEGLDEKLLLRADGTSVYMTQDIGTAILRYEDHGNLSGVVYTVGNEQDYHFKVLFLILQKLGYEWAQHCFHLSYGMVDLPSGKMKSREGTVVDADDLVNEMVASAETQTRELGKIDDFESEEAQKLYNQLGLGALKFFLLKVDPKKRMLFDPEESIQFQGHTGPFIQYTHARISAILRKAQMDQLDLTSLNGNTYSEMKSVEMDLCYTVLQLNAKIKEAADHLDPALLANYVFELAKEYNRFYAEMPIFNEEDGRAQQFRLALSKTVAQTIKITMGLLGIEVPDKM